MNTPKRHTQQQQQPNMIEAHAIINQSDIEDILYDNSSLDLDMDFIDNDLLTPYDYGDTQ